MLNPVFSLYELREPTRCWGEYPSSKIEKCDNKNKIKSILQLEVVGAGCNNASSYKKYTHHPEVRRHL